MKSSADIFREIADIKDRMTLMEVCGTHTMSIAKFGIKSLLPSNINIISGPGCPVCVTSSGDIFKAIQLAKKDDVIVATFGDMLRVPCNGDSLINYKNVKTIYNPMDSIKLAKDNPEKEVVLIGIGFETTAPIIASVIISADKDNIGNFTVLPMNKVVPPAVELIIGNKNNKIDGFILPGHVAAITGKKYFDFISEKGGRGVISGFDPVGISSSIYELVLMIKNKKSAIVNNYGCVVSDEGNVLAKQIMKDVFSVSDAEWRGLGVIKKSGLEISEKYSKFDAVKKFGIKNVKVSESSGCICGQILMGNKLPVDCSNYATKCTPSNPIGPCMVSSEGTCAAYYKYFRD